MRERNRQAEAAYAAKRRAERLAAALCPICPGKRPNPVEAGKTACRPCLDRRKAKDAGKRARGEEAARHAARAADKRARGECQDCPSPALPGKPRCAPCYQRRRTYSGGGNRAPARARRAARKARGQCYECADDAAPGKTRCADHLALRAAEQKAPERRASEKRSKAKRRARGGCMHCRRPAAPGIIRCELHRDLKSLKDRYAVRLRTLRETGPAERPAQGPKCSNCKRPPAPGKTRCEGHGETAALLGQIEKILLKIHGRTPEQQARARKAWRKTWHKRVAQSEASGLCVSCSRLPRAARGHLCETCRDARADADKAKRDANRAKGLCRCGDAAPVEGHTTCETCLERTRAKAAKRNARLRDAGRCVRCEESNPRTLFYALCESCSDTLEGLGARGIPCGDLHADGGCDGLWMVTGSTGDDLGEWATEGEALAAAWFSRDDGATVEHADDDATAFARIAARDGSLPPWLE